TTCSASVCLYPPGSSVLSLNPMVSTTSVSPSQRPTESPIQVGSGSAGCGVPSIGITRNKCGYSYTITTRSRPCTISHWYGTKYAPGTPVGLQVEYCPGSSGPRTTLNFSAPFLSVAAIGVFWPRTWAPPKLNELEL